MSCLACNVKEGNVKEICRPCSSNWTKKYPNLPLERRYPRCPDCEKLGQFVCGFCKETKNYILDVTEKMAYEKDPSGNLCTGPTEDTEDELHLVENPCVLDHGKAYRICTACIAGSPQGIVRCSDCCEAVTSAREVASAAAAADPLKNRNARNLPSSTPVTPNQGPSYVSTGENRDVDDDFIPDNANVVAEDGSSYEVNQPRFTWDDTEDVPSTQGS